MKPVFHSFQSPAGIVSASADTDAGRIIETFTDDDFRALCHQRCIFDYIVPGTRGMVAKIQPDGTTADFDLYEYTARNTDKVFSLITQPLEPAF